MTNIIRNQFSERFKLALKEAGYGFTQQTQLGELFNVSPQAVRKWLNCEAIPNSSRAHAVAAVLGVRRAWLIDGENPMRPLLSIIKEESGSYEKPGNEGISISNEEFMLIQSYRKLPIEIQQSFKGLLLGISNKNQTY